MNFLKIAWKDISSIFKNRFIRVSVTAIIIVPLLYSLLYLAAFWDPYSRLSSLPIAIINLDKGTVQDGQGKNYGKELEEKLSNNMKIGWRFVDYDEGMRGVKGKDYYAAFIIPENFSEDILSAKDGNPTKAEITYHANEKRNFLAAQINGKVLDELKAEITKGITQNYTEVVFDKLVEVKDGMRKAYDGSKELSDGIDKLNENVPQLKNGISQLYDGSTQLKNGIGQLNENVPMIQAGVAKLYDGSSQLAVGANVLNEGLGKNLTDAVNKLSKGSESLNTGSKMLNAGVQEFTKGSEKLVNQSKPLIDGVNTYVNGVNSLIDGSAESQKILSDAVENNLKAYIKSNPSALLDKNMISFLATLQSLNSKAKDAAPDIAKLQDGGNSIKLGMGQLRDGVNKLADGANEISKGAAEYANGAAEYAKGTEMLPIKLNEAVIGAEKLSKGATELNTGLSKLNDNMPLLAEGGNKLLDGSTRLSDGLKQLNDKVPDLEEGTKKLANGSKELHHKLLEGSNKLESNIKNDSKVMGEFVSEPLVINQQPINPVKDYGTGFAPYFISLSLWIGALMMFFVITDKVQGDIHATPASLVIGKFLSYGYIGIMQAVLASVVVLILGLRPANIPLYFLFNILLSFVFIAIMQSLIFLLGQVGRLLSIILLILQLTACAGTFPLELVPKFFKILNPFMPFTYSVSGLREIISGVDYSVIAKDSIILIAIMFVFLSISVVMKERADVLQEKINQKKDEAMIALKQI